MRVPIFNQLFRELAFLLFVFSVFSMLSNYPSFWVLCRLCRLSNVHITHQILCVFRDFITFVYYTRYSVNFASLFKKTFMKRNIASWCSCSDRRSCFHRSFEFLNCKKSVKTVKNFIEKENQLSKFDKYSIQQLYFGILILAH